MTSLIMIIAMMFTAAVSHSGGKPQGIAVSNYIQQSDIQFKEIVYAQAVLETGWFECGKDVGDPCSMDRNNLFGWYYKKRYLEFDTWEESIDYYERWQKRHYKGGDYYDFLEDRPFATGDKYVDKVKNIELNFK